MKQYILILSILIVGSIFGTHESYAEESVWQISDFTLEGGTLTDVDQISREGLITFQVEMDKDGYLIVPKTHHISANPDCTATNDFITLRDHEEVLYQINNNDQSIKIEIPSGTKEVELISSHILVFHTYSSTYAKFCKALDDGKHMSPYEQTKIGFLVDDVICKENLFLIFNELNNKPACVKTDNVEKFLGRGFSSEQLFKLPFSNMYKLNGDDDSVIRYHLYDADLKEISTIENGIRFHINSESSGMVSVSIPHEIMSNNPNSQDFNFETCDSTDSIRYTNTNKGNGRISFLTTSTHIIYLHVFHDNTTHIDFFCN